MADIPLSRQHTAPNPAPTFDKLENFNFLMSRHDPGLRSRHYSFDATDPAGLASLANAKFDYDQTEGMGGLSVSSYDSVDDDRGFDVRGYPEKSLSYALPDQTLLPYTTTSSTSTTTPIYPAGNMPTYTSDAGAGGLPTPSSISSSISPQNGAIGNMQYSHPIPSDRIASALTRTQTQTQTHDEQVTRVLNEEDRRRRNTAASARFRMKKKQREMDLERTVRETTERNGALEDRVAQLELENEWLRGIVTEKREVMEERQSQQGPRERGLVGAREDGEGDGRGGRQIQPKKKKGVGTNFD